MNIQEFTFGDVIHRVKPGGCTGQDRSYMGRPLTFKWLEKGVIFLECESYYSGGLEVITLTEYDWADGWDFYPIEAAKVFGVLKNETTSPTE